MGYPQTKMKSASGALRHRLETSRTMLKSGLKLETFDYAECKSIVDRIDQLLAIHYGLTEEELDFIINYDIKYRMGREAESEEE